MNDSAEQKEQFNGLDWMRGGSDGGVSGHQEMFYIQKVSIHFYFDNKLSFLFISEFLSLLLLLLLFCHHYLLHNCNFISMDSLLLRFHLPGCHISPIPLCR